MNRKTNLIYLILILTLNFSCVERKSTDKETKKPELVATSKTDTLKFTSGIRAEAHCYLKYNDLILDYTKQNSTPSDFIDDLIEEIEISPNQITDYKIKYHKNYLATWLDKTEQLNLTLNDLWTIREQCIQNLTDN